MIITPALKKARLAFVKLHAPTQAWKGTWGGFHYAFLWTGRIHRPEEVDAIMPLAWCDQMDRINRTA